MKYIPTPTQKDNEILEQALCDKLNNFYEKHNIEPKGCAFERMNLELTKDNPDQQLVNWLHHYNDEWDAMIQEEHEEWLEDYKGREKRQETNLSNHYFNN